MAGVKTGHVHLRQVTLCDSIWQMMLCSSEMGSHKEPLTYQSKSLLLQNRDYNTCNTVSLKNGKYIFTTIFRKDKFYLLFAPGLHPVCAVSC